MRAGSPPSVRFGPLSGPAAWDLDQAVLTFGEWVEAKLRATKPERVKALPEPGRGRVWTQVPVHDLGDLLGLERGADDDPALLIPGTALPPIPDEPGAWDFLGED